MIAGASRLELKYQYAAAAYWFIEHHCHDDIDPRRAKQRDITRWAFEIVRGARPDVQPFTNLLIQFPDADDDVPNRLAPDNSVFVHETELRMGDSFDAPFQPVVPFAVMEYAERKRAKDTATELKVSYYLLFDPDVGERTLSKLKDGKYVTVRPNSQGRYAISELELEVALLSKWMRYWFRGELVPLPGELLRERDAERAGRLAAEAELAKLRDELAKAKGQQPG